MSDTKADQKLETKVTQLTPSRFTAAEVVRNQWFVKPEFGTPMDALLDPAYWAHVSSRLRRGDHIYAMSEDNSYHGAFLVMDSGRLFAKVVKIPGMCFDIKSAEMLNVQLPHGYDIKWRGPRKWTVLRGKDVLKEDLEKADAENWLRDHVKAA